MDTGETFDPFPRPGHPDFKSFPKQIPEDTLEYFAYHIPRPGSPPPTPARERAALVDFQSACLRHAKELFKDHIWQRQGFSATVERRAGERRWCLRGSTAYADSIADEWAVVHLLREAGRAFPHIWVRLVDADGEFLLVEAARALPRWLDPDVAEHRVWVNQGRLRIVPKDLGAPAPARRRAEAITLDQAIECIASRGADLITSPQIEAESFHRIRDHPAAIADALHTARITVPRNLAYILHASPARITEAVDAFYLKDAVSLRPFIRAPARLRFSPGDPSDLVTVSAKFTRVSYAQLTSQYFNPPPSWMRAFSAARSDSADLRRLEVGMKVSVGFDLLLLDPANVNRPSVREIELLLSELESGEESLPTDGEMRTWPQVEQDEKWLDVNFDDFDSESKHRTANPECAEGSGPVPARPTETQSERSDVPGGESAAQANLRRMVQQFESFLNETGSEDDDDYGTDSDDEGPDSGEDVDASFSEQDFAKAMREMMGLPAEHEHTSSLNQDSSAAGPQSETAGGERVIEIDSDEDIIDRDRTASKASQTAKGTAFEHPRNTWAGMKDEIAAMEQELLAAGALDTSDRSIASMIPEHAGDRDGDGGDVADDPRYQLLTNMLQAFKGEGGAFDGPAGNLLRSMGIALPRDEEDVLADGGKADAV